MWLSHPDVALDPSQNTCLISASPLGPVHSLSHPVYQSCGVKPGLTSVALELHAWWPRTWPRGLKKYWGVLEYVLPEG